jgi:hypothetical protein
LILRRDRFGKFHTQSPGSRNSAWIAAPRGTSALFLT